MKPGDNVIVTLPGGEAPGKIVEVFPAYGMSGETKYLVHGDQLVTITSARTLRRTEAV